MAALKRLSQLARVPLLVIAITAVLLDNADVNNMSTFY
jgi:hypothetical protein